MPQKPLPCLRLYPIWDAGASGTSNGSFHLGRPIELIPATNLSDLLNYYIDRNGVTMTPNMLMVVVVYSVSQALHYYSYNSTTTH